MMQSTTIVVPVYNAELTLRPLVEGVHAVFSGRAASYELILVNDGSRDKSWDIINELAKEFDWVRGINLARNYGQHNALLCGIRAAESELIVTMDDDLQNPPEEIPKLLDKLDEGHDVVYGAAEEEQHSLWRVLASQITKASLQIVVGASVARKVSAFRAFRSQLRDAFAAFNGPYVCLDVLLTWATTRFAAVQVRQDARRAGVTNYTFRKLVKHALNMITGFTTLPLQVSAWIGFALTVFGAAILVIVIGRYLIQGTSVPGFPFLASIITIFSGAQLFALGIIGEYLARMYLRIMERPTYAVRSTTWRKQAPYGT